MAYSDSIYWALATMTSTGFGDISADKDNKLEMIVSSIVMVLGKMVFGLMLGNIASTLANMRMLRSVFFLLLYLIAVFLLLSRQGANNEGHLSTQKVSTIIKRCSKSENLPYFDRKS